MHIDPIPSRFSIRSAKEALSLEVYYCFRKSKQVTNPTLTGYLYS